ncbi:MAG TPA: hypothetical protein VMW50_15150 [Dehalococcoidia bacterium]|nr:hypothetical protein [Dehalococcoidia bacterium]
MIVITRLFSNGEVAHCDARCHNSTKKKCTCICKGLLHGKGEAYAKAQASPASIYLNMSGDDLTTYWPAPDLIPDRGGS